MMRSPNEEPVVTAMQNQLEHALGQVECDVHAHDWLNPVANLWSVSVSDTAQLGFSYRGCGLSAQEAKENALAGFVARLTCNDFFASYYLGQEVATGAFVYWPEERWFDVGEGELPQGLLDEPSLIQYNFHGNLRSTMLIDKGAGSPERGLCAIPMVRQQTQAPVCFPVSLINYLYQGHGVAVGASVFDARVKALSDIFERHIKTTILSSGISLPRVPDEVVAEFPAAQKAIRALEQQGFNVLVQDASLGGKFPLLNIVLMNPATGGCLAAFGAHPKFGKALEVTVAKLLNGRTLDDLGCLPTPTHDVDAVADANNIKKHCDQQATGEVGLIAWDLLSDKTDYTFTRWDLEGDAEAEFNHLCALIHKVDMDIYIADYNVLGLYACRIVVPGMSEVNDIDRLATRSDREAMENRQALLDLPNLSEADLANLESVFNQLTLSNEWLVTRWLGLHVDPESAMADMTMAELRLSLALANQHLPAADDRVAQLLAQKGLRHDKRAFYQCLQSCLAFLSDGERSLEDYHGALKLSYGKAVVERALAMLEGRRLFEQCITDDLQLKQLKHHQALIAQYKRLQKAKLQGH